MYTIKKGRETYRHHVHLQVNLLSDSCRKQNKTVLQRKNYLLFICFVTNKRNKHKIIKRQNNFTKIKTKCNHTSFSIIEEFFNSVKSFIKEILSQVLLENNLVWRILQRIVSFIAHFTVQIMLTLLEEDSTALTVVAGPRLFLVV